MDRRSSASLAERLNDREVVQLVKRTDPAASVRDDLPEGERPIGGKDSPCSDLIFRQRQDGSSARTDLSP